ncbi:DUF368 domain-containing protein [Corynebacterium pacaense]|uniref:DUF368 domain-containing protein n=1 Tax=Corynebacterium pacaense TaxID=1816684 RepID=UPI0009BB70D9|nr:DUF368 domain-containing protein [Corynebacterium pacaense]
MSASTTDTHLYPAKTKKTPLAVIVNLIRGALIGMAELVPGISGGTVALVIGVYERALHNGNLLIDLIKSALRDRSQLKATAATVDWWFLAAVGVGMVTAVFSMSTVLHGFVENHAEIARGLFMGMVAVSIIVPIGMMDLRDVRRRLAVVIPLFLAAAVLSFFGTGLTSAPQDDPSLFIIFIAAAIAVCALVMPGISGSFFLMAMGLYAPVMASLSNREWDVIAIFILGALTGVVLFVRFLSYVLEYHRTITLTIMAGLMLGSLRALWPWQDSDANLLAPTDQVGPVLGMVALGAFTVAAVMIIERITPKNTGAETIASGDPA